MGFFKKLFGGGIKHTKFETVDPELGQFNSDFVKGTQVTWIGNTELFGKNVELIMDGNQDGISPVQKEIVMTALSNKENLKTESAMAIRQEYKNAEMEFRSLLDDFKVMALTTNDDGFELSFEQLESPYYYFNVFFENKKQIGVSIDS